MDAGRFVTAGHKRGGYFLLAVLARRNYILELCTIAVSLNHFVLQVRFQPELIILIAKQATNRWITR